MDRTLLTDVICVLNVADDMCPREDSDFPLAFETILLVLDTFEGHEPSLRSGLMDVIENGQELFADSEAALLLLADVARAINEYDDFRELASS
jgi:hypothetical protein